MGTRSLFHLREEEQKEERQQSLHMSSTTRKKKFKTRDYKLRREAAILELEQRGQKRVRFGNEMEKLEKEVIRNCRLLRARADRKALRRKAVEKARVEKEYIELRSGRAPMFWIPLRVHAVWERMEVTLACTVLASPPPHVTWYKNGVRIDPRLAPAGKYRIKNKFGMLTLHISRCSMEDSAEYSVEVKNQYGEAYSFATVLVRRDLSVQYCTEYQISLLVGNYQEQIQDFHPWICAVLKITGADSIDTHSAPAKSRHMAKELKKALKTGNYIKL